MNSALTRLSTAERRTAYTLRNRRGRRYHRRSYHITKPTWLSKKSGAASGTAANNSAILHWHMQCVFVSDLAARITSEYVQVTSDGCGTYVEAIERYFPRADYGTEIKVYGRTPFESADSKYSPMVVKDVIRTVKLMMSRKML